MLALAGMFFQLAGCSSAEDKPIWEDVKLADLIPSRQGRDQSKWPPKTIDFNIFIFEMPAKAVTVLDDIWPMLYAGPLDFIDGRTFSANLFSAGFGRQHMWEKVAGALRRANARKVRTESLFLLDGQANDVMVSSIYGKQSISYLSSGGFREQREIGPGAMVLRLRAEKVPAARGVCNVTVVPMFSLSASSAVPQLAAQLRAGEVAFESVSFTVKMSPGDFVFLGPKKHVSYQADLAGRFFSRASGRYPLRTFLIVCSTVGD